MENPGRLDKRSIAAIAGLCVLAIGPGMMTHLSYHEAIVAQGVREMRQAGTWLVPLLDQRPWLEKPPLLHWLIKLGALCLGDVSECVARFPSLLGTIGLALAVANLATRRFNPRVGLIAGCVQATTFWTINRGRLAEADMLLACLIAWIIVIFDQVRTLDSSKQRLYLIRLVIIAIGMTSLLKGLIFGASLIVVSLALILAWDRNSKLFKALFDPVGLVSTLLVAVAWPAIIVARYPQVVGQWMSHVTDRFADRPEIFAGQASWWAYLPAVLSQTLPWAPFALVGAWRSLGRARGEQGGVDRLLWAWAVGPLVLLSMATVKNPHYAIHALAPWSIWTALTLIRIGDRINTHELIRVFHGRRILTLTFVLLAIAFGVGYGVIAPRRDARSMEWAFYDSASHQIHSKDDVVLLYDDWDRLAYPTPFGPVPHDLAIRLYYLRHEVIWRAGKGAWTQLPDRSFLAVARDRDVPGLSCIGQVERVLQGPSARWDRTYALFRVTPSTEQAFATAQTSLK